jgi:hypothetical protein
LYALRIPDASGKNLVELEGVDTEWKA